jgi:hypothetical protein
LNAACAASRWGVRLGQPLDDAIEEMLEFGGLRLVGEGDRLRVEPSRWIAGRTAGAGAPEPGTPAVAAALSRMTSMRRAMHTESGHTVETGVEARAGFLDHPVLVVLAVSVGLVTLLFGLVGFGILG